MPTITKITIGRLFNLGSYEHVRYELTAEIHSGESVEETMIGLEKIIEGLNPKRTCKDWGEIKREEFRLAELRTMSDDEFHRRQGIGYVGTREEYQNRIAAGIAEEKERTSQWEKRHAKARLYLDNLGGAHKHVDAKLDWENDYYDEP
jgi:hypothetical protein